MENNRKKFIDFIITQKCTYRCPYCSQSKCQNNKQNNATNDTINAFYDFLDNIDKDYEITITGGEAILHPDFFEIITKIKEKGFKINLISNLSFKIETYQKIFNLLDDKLNRFDISLHLCQIQNFNMTLEKLETFIKSKPKNTKMNIFIPLYKFNKKDESNIYKITKLAEKFKIQIGYQPIRFLGQKKKYKNSLNIKTNQINKTFSNLCYAGLLSAVIYEDGNVYRCYSSRFIKSNSLGNIKDKGFSLNSKPKVCVLNCCTCPKPEKYRQITNDKNYKEAIKTKLLDTIFLPILIIKNRKIVIQKLKQFIKL